MDLSQAKAGLDSFVNDSSLRVVLHEGKVPGTGDFEFSLLQRPLQLNRPVTTADRQMPR